MFLIDHLNSFTELKYILFQERKEGKKMFMLFVCTCILPHKLILDLKDYIIVGCCTCRFTEECIFLL